ncbi:PREDICTED: protein FAR1-RELATED SEQUENCE 5-like [Fragaria vesca subsp. vesca]|uniref:protein FAR1-RELATED SEQUENCE 5-like n=1 Tax=Fragaria vesca subsp. vesca TaxID=101020 RepID=UPI0002C2DC65|nr:PREDICTED: protein FAR1-RELATED SEQUENCE 5-like [Fragaria vesca subsp. vesca]
MKGAIAKIFPNTRHRLCLWHIKKKFVEKLSHVYYKKSKFKKEMKRCIQFTYKTEDFEEKWKALMKENGLEENDWLKSLYEIRASWVPVYNRGTFFAGMNTIGQHKFRIVNDDEFLLKDAAKLYTRNVFNKFKGEWTRINHYKVEERDRDNEWPSYLVKKRLGEHEQDFIVRLDLTTYNGSCECQNFEFVGILCRHLLKVFSRLDIETIPAHFILPRWRQEANKFRIMDLEDLARSVGNEESEALRLDHMCHQATKLACIAAHSKEGYTLFMEALNDISKKLSKIPDQPVISKEMSAPINQEDHPVMETCVSPNRDDPCTNTLSSQSLLLDPNISKTKGRKKETKSSGRIKSGVELAMETRKRKCTLCLKSGHNKKTCSLNSERKIQ